jgi:hypothetical protein
MDIGAWLNGSVVSILDVVRATVQTVRTWLGL